MLAVQFGKALVPNDSGEEDRSDESSVGQIVCEAGRHRSTQLRRTSPQGGKTARSSAGETPLARDCNPYFAAAVIRV